MGIPELLIILLVVLVIFGPKNLPKLGKSLGATVKNVREGLDEGKGDDAKQADSTDAEVVKDEVVQDDDDADVEDAPAGDDADADGVFCTHCGTKNPSGAAFCSKCGAKL